VYGGVAGRYLVGGASTFLPGMPWDQPWLRLVREISTQYILRAQAFCEAEKLLQSIAVLCTIRNFHYLTVGVVQLRCRKRITPIGYDIFLPKISWSVHNFVVDIATLIKRQSPSFVQKCWFIKHPLLPLGTLFLQNISRWNINSAARH
jgi:hypothetical protein